MTGAPRRPDFVRHLITCSPCSRWLQAIGFRTGAVHAFAVSGKLMAQAGRDELGRLQEFVRML